MIKLLIIFISLTTIIIASPTKESIDVKSKNMISSKKNEVNRVLEKELTEKELLDKIVDKLDNLFREKSSYSIIEMQIKTNYFKRMMKMKIWSKGLDNSLIKIVAPKKDRGISTLKKGKDIYNYFPKINKIMKIPSSMMMGSWMGSDFTNDDLVKDSGYKKDYKISLIKSEDKTIYKVQFIPKKDSITVWGKIIVNVNKKNLLPIKEIFYDERDKAVREMNFKDIKEIDGKLIPTVMELIPLTKSKKGNITTITYKKIKFNVKLKKNFFSLQNLRR